MSKSNQIVAIKVNQNNLMANLKFSFSNKHTILGEMMQNARRAGASFIKFTTSDNGELTILDDGKGIDDFQNLFSVAESGWDIETLQKEKPFGMGWLSCLYGSDEIFVESNGRCISGNSQAILSGEGIDVFDTIAARASYTQIVLKGFSLNKEQVKAAVHSLSRGFPLDVYVNDDLMVKPHSLNCMAIKDYHRVSVPALGEFFIPMKQACQFHTVMYLQGLPVYCSYNSRFSHNDRDDVVVHLDSENIFARMPDRDKLIDESDVIAKVNKVINQHHLSQLIKLKNELSPEAFATREITEYAMSIQGGFDVISGKDVLLSDYFYGAISDQQPSCNNNEDKLERKYPNQVGSTLSYDQFKNGEVMLCEIEDMDENEECNSAAFVFARALGWHVLDDHSKHHRNTVFDFKKHWLNEFMVDLHSRDIEYHIVGETKRETYSFSNWPINFDVVLCESYDLTFKDQHGNTHEATVTDEPLLTMDGLLLIPHACSSEKASSMSVEQGYGYYWDEDFHDDVRDEDMNAFTLYLTLMRSGNECDAIAGHINNNVTFYDYAKFKDVEYKFKINEAGVVSISRLEPEAIPA